MPVRPASKLPPDSSPRVANTFWLKEKATSSSCKARGRAQEFCKGERLEAFGGQEEGRRQVRQGPGTIYFAMGLKGRLAQL